MTSSVSRWLADVSKETFGCRVVFVCNIHLFSQLNGYNKRLLRESRGIPQREKMKNNFQFESILKNANGDNKAFPKLGNVLMLPNQKICRLTTRKRVDNLIYGRREKSQKPSKIKGLRHVSSQLSWIEHSPPKRGVGGSNPLGDGLQSVRKCQLDQLTTNAFVIFKSRS